MNNKQFLGICTLIFLFAVAYWLDNLLAVSAWATLNDDNQWSLNANGWKILLSAWPLSLLGLIISVPLSFVAVFYSLHKANELDQNQKFKQLTDEAKEAQQEAKTANQRAEQKYLQRNQKLTEQEELLEEKHQVMTKLRQQFELWKTEQEQLVKEANARADAATQRAEESEKSRINAAATAERRRRKIERLENEKQTN